MEIEPGLFREIVKAVTPLLTRVPQRANFMNMAFPGRALAGYHRIAAEFAADDTGVYAGTLLTFLRDAARLPDGGEPLVVYLATVRDLESGDAAVTLTRILARSEAQEQARTLLRQHGFDPDADILEQVVTLYLEELVRDFEQAAAEYVDLGGTQRRVVVPPRPTGRAAWLDPTTDLELALGHVALEGIHRADDSALSEEVANVRERLLRVRRGVLLGEPGSGKSWTLWRLALDYAAICLGTLPDPAPGRLPVVPVLVRLRSFRGIYPEGSSLAGQPLDFGDFVLREAGLLAPYLTRLAREGRLIFLLDALNEMPLAGGGRKLVDQVVAFLRDKPCFVLTCRARDYRDDLSALRQLEQLALGDLTPPQIHELLCRRLGLEQGAALWHELGGCEPLLDWWRIVCEAGQAASFWDVQQEWPWELRTKSWAAWEAWRTMQDAPGGLIALCRNPYMAFMVSWVYVDDKGRLPSNHAALFGRFVERLLDLEMKRARLRQETWPQDEEVRTALVEVALTMQEAAGTELPRAAAERAIHHVQPGWLLDAAVASSLLVEAETSVRFSHQLLQEYFAAHTLREAMRKGENSARFFGAAWWERGEWAVTAIILGELEALGSGLAGPNAVARWLAPANPEVALDVVLGHGGGLTLADVEGETRAALVASARVKMYERDPRGRAAAYRVLGLFGADDRPGAGVRADGLADMEWVQVQGGVYRIGGDEAAWHSLPAQEVELGAFWIAKYPVTNAQWQAFVDDAEGYHDPQERWWEGLAGGKQSPAEPAWRYGNHPRESVNWYEAVAYCRWLSWRLGYAVRLPTEIEWEAAARGRPLSEGAREQGSEGANDQGKRARYFPWGDEYEGGNANIDETNSGYTVGPYYLQQTSAVGMYPQGVTPEGVCDLSGNVWEWTGTLWAGGGIDIISSAPRVLRGGSWNYNPQDARAASRNRLSPQNRDRDDGFRVVALAPAGGLDSGALDSGL